MEATLQGCLFTTTNTKGTKINWSSRPLLFSYSREDDPDVPADEPARAMDYFTEGLRRVLAVGKKRVSAPRAKRKRKRADIK